MEPASVSNEITYDLLFFQSTVAMFTCNPEGEVSMYNSAAVEIWGNEPHRGQGSWGWDSVFDQDGVAVQPDLSPMAIAVRDSRYTKGEVFQFRQPEGTLKKILVIAGPLFRNNTLIGGQASMFDITEIQNDDSRQAVLSAIVDSSDDAIIGKNLNGYITSWNAGAERIFGYSESEATGKHITMLIPGSRLQEEDRILGSIRAGNKVDHFETIRLNKQGKEVPISVTVSPIKDNRGKIIGASKIARNISERVRSQQLIRESNINLEILNSFGKLISEKLDSAVVLERVVDAMLRITGCTAAAFVPLLNLENSKPGIRPYLATTNGADITITDFQGVDFTKKVFDGHIVLANNLTDESDVNYNIKFRSFLGAPLFDLQDRVVGGLFFADSRPGIFQQTHTEIISSIASQTAVALDNAKLFEEVNKLSAKKDEFIALASHELKTPLTTIKGYLQVLKRYSLDGPESIFVEKCLIQAERLNNLIAELLDVSKIESGKLELHYKTFDLVELVHEVALNFAHTENTHQVIINAASEYIEIFADQQRIEQVLINLVSNAVKYSPKADKVYIDITGNDQTAQVSIRDEGMGIRREDIDKIFNRFFRAEGHSNISGLGLGLYLTYEIVKRHNGTIKVKSEVGGGSEFTISIPAKGQQNQAF